VAKGENAEAIKSAISELEQASHALSATLYSGGARPGGAAGDGTAQASGDGKRNGDEETIDAEFEVKKE
jgi:molecular chaperone DnaK